MAADNSNKWVVSLKNKVNDLEYRLKFLEHYLNMDEEAIISAMEEKGDLTDTEEELNYGNV